MLPSNRIQIHVDAIFYREVASLPWEFPIAEWPRRGVEMLDIKRGISRHVVIFVRSGRYSFGIKEISEEISKREISNYEELLLRGIHTLIPVGYVVRTAPPIAVQTPIGIQYESGSVSHTVTLLLDRVLPDSELYPRAFTSDNRRKIWDTIAELFVELHTNGVYWGDASLANTLIKFEKIDVPFVGRKTALKAYLADAETVEFKPYVPESMREAELSFFLESMEWLNEDLRLHDSSKIVLTTTEDQKYLKEQYELLTAVEAKKKEFERQTSFNMDRFLGQIHNPSYVDLFLKHIEEHKWYLSEASAGSVSLEGAAHDWYQNVYVPVCELFRREKVVDFFPGKTAAELYIEIMTNKYYLSQQEGKDVGMVRAVQNYAEKFGVERSFLEMMSGKLASIFRGEE